MNLQGDSTEQSMHQMLTGLDAEHIHNACTIDLQFFAVGKHCGKLLFALPNSCFFGNCRVS